jgi:hypothetical protein
MKNGILLLACMALLATGCGSDASESTGKMDPEVISGKQGTPVLTFQDTRHNFGNVNEGDILEWDFKFTNTGDGDLLISNASATCGCTVPQWPKYPIKPGQTDVIPVRFDTQGKHDAQTKTVTITANTNPAETQITISAFIKKDN